MSSVLWSEVLQPWADSHRFPPNQSDIARVVGVTRGSVSNWKIGATMPSAANVRAIAAATGIDYLAVLAAVLTDAGYLEDGEQVFDLLAAAVGLPVDPSAGTLPTRG